MTTRKITFNKGDLFLNGDYRLEAKLGEGGMGQVWAAIEIYSGNLVAIKMMHDQGGNFALRFRQECRFYTKLKHPNIVSMFKAGEDENGVMYIVMDLLMGKTVRKVLQTSPNRRIDVARALHLAIQLADAGSYMHGKDVWHRDLKPENLMVGTKDELKGHLWVFDFGIAKFANAEDHGLISDELPDVATVRYMAPEQVDLTNRRKVDGRADIYSFGAILYEKITGRHIFIREDEPTTAAQIMCGHVVAPIKPIPEIVPACPEDVWRLVEKCLAKDPAKRYQRFGDIATALRGMLRGSLPSDDYIARRIEQEQFNAARAHAFAEAPMDDEPDGSRLPEGGGEPDVGDRPALLGEAPGVTLEVAPRLQDDIATAKTEEVVEAKETASEEPPLGETTEEIKTDAGAPRIVRTTEPMPLVFMPPARVLPFGHPAAMGAPPGPTNAGSQASPGPGSAPNPPPEPPKRGRGHTVRMPSAATLPGHATPPAAVAPPSNPRFGAPPLNGTGPLPTADAHTAPAITSKPTDTPPDPGRPAVSVPAPSESSNAPNHMDVHAPTEPVRPQPRVPETPLTPISIMTMQPTPSPTLPVPLPPATRAPVTTRRRSGYTRAVAIGLMIGAFYAGVAVLIRYRASFWPGHPTSTTDTAPTGASPSVSPTATAAEPTTTAMAAEPTAEPTTEPTVATTPPAMSALAVTSQPTATATAAPKAPAATTPVAAASPAPATTPTLKRTASTAAPKPPPLPFPKPVPLPFRLPDEKRKGY